MAALTGALRARKFNLDRNRNVSIVVLEQAGVAAAGGHIPAANSGIASVLEVLAVSIENASAAAAPAQASGSITFNDAGGADETITIDGIVYTLKATPAAAFEVDIGASATASANNLRDAINRGATAGTDYGADTAPHPSVKASAASAVVTITARVPGTDGNSVTLAASDTATSITLSGATLSGGENGGGGAARAFPNSQSASTTEDDAGDIFIDHGGSGSQTVKVTVIATLTSPE